MQRLKALLNLKAMLIFILGMVISALLLLTVLIYSPTLASSGGSPSAVPTPQGDIVVGIDGAYLTHAANTQSNGSLTNLHIQPRAGDLLQVTGDYQLLPLLSPASVEAEVKPVVQNGGIAFQVISGMIGSLRLPSQIDSLIQAQMQPAASQTLQNIPSGYQVTDIYTTDTQLFIVLNPK